MTGINLGEGKGNKFSNLNEDEKKAYMREAKKRHRARKKGELPPIEKKNLGSEYHRAYNKDYRPRKEYGITREQYDKLIRGKECGICKSTENIVLDHCHNTGSIRGPLCDHCNRGIGFFRDDPEKLRAAADYLEVASLFV